MQDGESWVSKCEFFNDAIHICVNIIRSFNLIDSDQIHTHMAPLAIALLLLLLTI